jgi:general secretion pathway protein K
MRLQPQSSQRGVALIIVMLVVAVLGMLAGAFAYSMKVETTLARNANNDFEYEWLGRSGIELARYLVGQQLSIAAEPYDSLNQKWAGGPSTNEIFANVKLDDNQLGLGTFSVRIIDLERKFNVNVADSVVLMQALSLVGVDATESSSIADSILDWIDADDDTHLSGTESDYYLNLTPPYQCKNGPIDNISELLLIRGVAPEMFWGSSGVSRPAPASPSGRVLAGLRDAGPVYTNALADIFTPLSIRVVNINTASSTVLQMIPVIDATIAAGIIAHRSGPDGQDGTEDDLPFRSPGELVNVPGLSRQAVGNAARVFSVRSATYEVHVTVDIGGRKREMVGVIFRNNTPRDVRLLYAYWK